MWGPGKALECRPRAPWRAWGWHAASVGGSSFVGLIGGTSFVRGTQPQDIARGLVNQPCWWAHRSSDARQSGALHWSEARGLKTQSLHCTRPRKPAVLVYYTIYGSSEARGLSRGLIICRPRRGHFVCPRHAASRLSHFIARGLVNQPCWWAHRSSEARGLVTKPWAQNSCMLTWPLHVDHVGLDVHDVSMVAGMRGGILVHNGGLPLYKGNDGRPRGSRDVEYHCISGWNIHVCVMQHI